MLKKIWDWLKSLPLKVWTWLKNVNWLYVFDSDEFTFTFPLVVLGMATIFERSILLGLATVVWGIKFWRSYGE